MNDNTVSNHPKESVAAITVGLEGLSLLIPNQIVQKTFLIISPGIALVIIILFKNWHRRIESLRGLKTYNTMIAELERDLSKQGLNDSEKKEIQAEINNCKAKIRKIKVDNIEIIIK